MQASRTVSVAGLPSKPLAERASFPTCACSYVVKAGDKVLYVGQTQNLRQRWVAHHLLSELAQHKDVRVSWYECRTKYEREFYEQSAIELFKPPYNKAGLRRSVMNKSVSVLLHSETYQALEKLAGASGKLVSEQARLLIDEALRMQGLL